MVTYFYSLSGIFGEMDVRITGVRIKEGLLDEFDGIWDKCSGICLGYMYVSSFIDWLITDGLADY